MSAIEAIPCTYAGVPMKSRLESRWAAFFKGLDTPWQYEPRKFRLRGQYSYTPDFYLPDIDVIVEVKHLLWRDDDVAAKYIAYAPYLVVKRSACRMFVLASGHPDPIASYRAYWKHGWREFAFDRVFGDDLVRRACSYSHALHSDHMPARAPREKRNYCFIGDVIARA